MAGRAGATLTGHAIPTVAFAFWDHTYVTSSCGLIWACLGNTTRPNPICSSIGDSSIADCLSNPNGTAGIRYFVDGVCHQISNRILHPASVVVASARGYGLSVFRYGTYGKNLPSPRLSACYPSGRGAGQTTPGLGDSDMSFLVFSEVDRIAGTLVQSEDRALDKHPNRVEELRLLVDSIPGLFMDHATFASLAEIQNKLWLVEDSVTELFQTGSVSSEEFYDTTMSATKIAMQESRELLGSKFFLLFGEAGSSPECLMNKDVFINMSKNDHVRWFPHNTRC